MHSTPNIPTPGNQICSESKFKWYCVRTKPKQEPIASNSIRELVGVEVFCPIIRFKKSTKRGKIWFQEALFPGYLFVKCDLKPMFKAVNYSRGVAALLRFGSHYPTIPEKEIEILRKEMGDNEVHIIAHEFEPGEKTRIESGPFKGISAVISRVMPAKERVLVLLDLLGGKIEAEVNESALATPKARPAKGGPREAK